MTRSHTNLARRFIALRRVALDVLADFAHAAA